MTEQTPQPQNIQPPTIGGPLVPPEQAPPPAEEAPPGDGMRFMVRIQDNPDLPNYNQPQSLHRFKITPEEIVTDRFDADAKMWVDNPGMIAFTGIGGADDFVEIDIDNANALISQWLGESFMSGQPSEEEAAGAGGPSDGGLEQEIFGPDFEALQQIEVTPEKIQEMRRAIESKIVSDAEKGLDDRERSEAVQKKKGKSNK